MDGDALEFWQANKQKLITIANFTKEQTTKKPSPNSWWLVVWYNNQVGQVMQTERD